MSTSSPHSRAERDPVWARGLLIGATVGLLGVFLFLPLVLVFQEAFQKGVALYVEALTEENARSAIGLTLSVAAISVPLNALFGVAAAWAVTKFEFRAKSLLLALIDLPFAVSPVVAGMVYLLLFGAGSFLGKYLDQRGIQIVFALPGMALATVFVTFPFVARELIPLMQAQGSDQEMAAISLGASGWQTFRRVTLPNIRWALFYGIVLSNARAMGEFGAVSVISGHIRGETNTLPLHVEVLYNEYHTAAAFACASLLSLLGLGTLVLKSFIEWRAARNHGRP
jgi:sulfate transport system permease protein